MAQRIVTLIAVAISFILSGCSVVDSGTVGVQSKFGEVLDETLDEGLHITPIVSVSNISLRAQTFQIAAAHNSANSAAVNFAVPQDAPCPEGATDCEEQQLVDTMQQIGYNADIQWHIANAEAARQLYQSYGLREGRESEFAMVSIVPVAYVAAKSVFSQHSLRELLVSSRLTAGVSIRETLQTLINERLEVPEGSVIIDDVSLSNFSYGEELAAMFSATVSASEQRNLAQQELERVRIQAQQQVASADAAAAALRIEADAELYRLTQEADADHYRRSQEAASLATLSEAGVDVNEYLQVQIEMMRIDMMEDKWSGNVPMVTSNGSGSGSVTVVPLDLAP